MTWKQVGIFFAMAAIGYSPVLAHSFGLWVFAVAAFALLAVVWIQVRDFREMRRAKRLATAQQIREMRRAKRLATLAQQIAEVWRQPWQEPWRDEYCVVCGRAWQVRGDQQGEITCTLCLLERRRANG